MPRQEANELLELLTEDVAPAEYPLKGKTIYVHALDDLTIERWQIGLQRSGVDVDEPGNPKAVASLIALCCHNQAGEKLWGAGDVERLAAGKSIHVQPLFDLCQRQNGLGVYGLAVKKNWLHAALSARPSPPASAPAASTSAAP